jgi:hypothetical protein
MPRSRPDVADIADRHRHTAQIVLTAIEKVRGKPTREAPWGLSGGNALIAHRLSARKTMDVDVAISQMTGDWPDIERAIEEEFTGNGYTVRAVDKLAGVVELMAGEDEVGLSEWIVSAPGDDEEIQVQVSNFDLFGAPVDIPGVGPVVALGDVAGWKTIAFSNRRMPRDAYDLAELRTRFTVDELLRLAWERDPGLDSADIADAGRYLDNVKDAVLSEVVAGTRRTPAWVRKQLADWPRR